MPPDLKPGAGQEKSVVYKSSPPTNSPGDSAILPLLPTSSSLSVDHSIDLLGSAGTWELEQEERRGRHN